MASDVIKPIANATISSTSVKPSTGRNPIKEARQEVVVFISARS